MTYLIWLLPMITLICFSLAIYGHSTETKKLKRLIEENKTGINNAQVIIDRESKVIFLIYRTDVDVETAKYLGTKMYEDVGYYVAVIGGIDKVELT